MIYLSLWCENRVTRYWRSEFIYLLLLLRTGNLGTQLANETVAAILIVIIVVVLVVVVVTQRHCRRCGCCVWWSCCYGFGFRINREKDSRQNNNNIMSHFKQQIMNNYIQLCRDYSVRKIRLAILNTQVESKAVLEAAQSLCTASIISPVFLWCTAAYQPIQLDMLRHTVRSLNRCRLCQEHMLLVATNSFIDKYTHRKAVFAR